MSFNPARSTTTDILSATNVAPVLDKANLTTSPPGLGRASQSLLFVDGGVSDYQQLVAGVAPGTEVHVLNSAQDAVTQITNVLLGRSGVSSLQIVSHGESGGLDFGSSRLNLTDLPGYAAQVQSWGKALTEDADLLLYGCNVASGELGKAFVNILGQLTGADVAASDNLTGSAALGGDWTLEVQTGGIETTVLNAVDYNSVLATFTVTNSADTGTGSLRDAVTQANAAADADNIVFNLGAGAQTITLSEVIGINNDLTIQGTGANNLTVQVNDNMLNVFTITSGKTASFSGLTISGGNYGIYNLGTIASVTNSSFSNSGTGIFTVDGSTTGTISNNTFSANNRGISNSGGNIALIANNTFSSNQIGFANNPGEGVSNVSEFVNNTIAGNTSAGISNTATIGNLHNNLLVSNGSNTIGGTITSQSNNLLGTFAELGVDPTLSTNGGPTDTHALLIGSTAINAGDSSKIPAGVTTDQRGTGFDRISGGSVDIGAFEVQVLPTLSIAAGITPVEPTPNALTNGSYTLTLSSATTSDLTVNFSLGGSATNSTDYALIGGTGISNLTGTSFVIAAGTTSATLTVQVVDDTLEEAAETIQLTLASGTGYALGATPSSTSSTLTIAANDAPIPIVTPPIEPPIEPPIVVPEPVSIRQTTANDYDGDGKADLLITRANTTGKGHQFTSNTYSLFLSSSNTVVSIATLSTNFQLVATGDYNGDGKADLLWKNTANNTYSTWFLSGNSYIGGGEIATLSSNFQIVSSADCNGDGKADLIWKDSNSNSYSTWFLNGNTYIGGGTIATVAANFELVATGDYNGDGKADLLWRNTANNSYSNWFLDGNTYIGGGTIATLSSNFSVAYIADYNGDGKADLLWKDSNSNSYSTWFLSGNTYIGGGTIATLPVNFEVVSSRDYNGDGKADLVWRNQSNGALSEWFLNGFSYLDGKEVGTVETGSAVRG